MFRSALTKIAFATLMFPAIVSAQTIVYGDQLAEFRSPETPANPPKLIVAISVDQFSADLFAEYRGQFVSGLKALQDGAVFPSGYQSHSATETCPGHSTILTGNRPARTGIIANDWIDQSVAREDKTVYCAEDETVTGSNSRDYTVSDIHLKVPTLGERMKAANPATRVVSVAGKDRAAVMMGGHNVDELWWWNGKSFQSYAGRNEPAAVTRASKAAADTIAMAHVPMDLSKFCASHNRAISIGDGKTVGTGRFERSAGDARGFRSSPDYDHIVLGLAGDLIEDMKLGQGSATDIISIGASGTDYVGHTYGTSGSEMCIQLMALDQQLGDFFARLNTIGVDYVVALTADHGGHDLPERIREQAMPEAARIAADASPQAIGAMIAKKLGLKEQPLQSRGLGDVWIDTKLNPKQRAAVLKEAIAAYRAHPMMAAVFTKDEISAIKMPTSPPDTWTLIERARASFDPAISGDFYFALKPRITPIPDPGGGYVATHGSIWDYDRRVPILFWRKNMARFEQPLSVETVDIAPTLAALINLPVADGEFDGRCLDLDAGPATTCN